MNKGFTLIELMAVIILLGILSLIATMTVNSTLKGNRQKACEMQIENIKSGAKNWASKNAFILPGTEGAEVIITLEDLQNAGFLDKEIKNPKTDELFSKDIQITITRIDNNYKYEVGVEC